MRLRAALALTAAPLVAITLAACSATASPSKSPTAASSSAPSGAATTTTGTSAEIAFAQLMITHHQQAVEMADLALAKSNSPQVRTLATQIKQAQAPEIAQMQGWLAAWGQPSTMPSSTAGGGSGHMDGMHGTHDMGGVSGSGMMTDEQMTALSHATGTDFDRMWLQMMIAHHEGAIQMANEVNATNPNAQVTALANSIIATQTAEIATMRQYLATLG